MENRAKRSLPRSLDCDEFPAERALGVQWCLKSDTFKFTIKIDDKPATRRGILSMVPSVIDPLGFVAPSLLRAKKILQDLCWEPNLKWDDPVPNEYVVRWDSWLNELHLLEHFTVNRCIKPTNFGVIGNSQLHVFSDASSLGYGVAAYLHPCNTEGTIHCSFLSGKAR